jgi:hypothetical protein
MRKADRKAWSRGAALLLAAVSAAASPLDAAEYRAREIAGWTVSETTDGAACLMGMEYEGEGATRLVMSLDPEGSNRLIVTNMNWSIKEDEELTLDYALSNGTYAKHPAVGMRGDGRGGFVTGFEKPFPDYFAQSRYLHIRRDGTLVDRLSLDGTGAAVVELRRCVAAVRARAAAEAREKARWADIPTDPFKPDPVK